MKIMRWLLLTLLTGGVAVADAQADFATDDERNTIQVFEKARPSVVFVTNQQLVRDPRSLNLLEVPRGSGTGFVWDESGYIVTNFHVVDGARKVMITLQDQSTWPTVGGSQGTGYRQPLWAGCNPDHWGRKCIRPRDPVTQSTHHLQCDSNRCRH